MTKKKSVLITLDEILTLHLECADEECRTKVVLESNASRKPPSKCPGCGREWWAEITASNSDSAGNTLRNFQINILRLIEFQKTRKKQTDPHYHLGCNVALEIRESEGD